MCALFSALIIIFDNLRCTQSNMILQVVVRAVPTNADNKLANGLTNFIFTPITSNDHLETRYSEGIGKVCRYTEFDNPYNQCGANTRSMEKICLHSTG